MSASDPKRTWKTLGRRLLDRGLVVASGRSERDIEPVPPVDSNDAQRKLRELLFAKFFASLVISLIRNFLVCETGSASAQAAVARSRALYKFGTSRQAESI